MTNYPLKQQLIETILLNENNNYTVEYLTDLTIKELTELIQFIEFLDNHSKEE